MAAKKSTKNEAAAAEAKEAPEATPAQAEPTSLPTGHVRLKEPFKAPEGQEHIQWSGQKVKAGATTMPKQLADALQLDYTEE